MFWKAILILNSVKMTFTSAIVPKKVVLLENKFWGESQNQIKTDKGYLSEVEVSFRNGDNQILSYKCYLSEGFWCKANGKRYNVLKEKKVDEIKSYLASSEDGNRYLRLWFTFTDIPIIDEKGFKSKVNDKKYYIAYLVIKKSEKDFFEIVRNDGIDIRMISIKESFKFYVRNKFIRRNKIVEQLIEKRSQANMGDFVHDANFELYYFKDHYDCNADVKKFCDDISYLRLLAGNGLGASSNVFVQLINGMLCFLGEKKLMATLRSKFDQLQGQTLELSGPSRCLSTETLELLFKKACNHLKEKLYSKTLFIAIGGDYNIDYYLEELFKIIYKVITTIYKTYDTIPPEEEDAVFEFLYKSLDDLFENLEITSVKNICESTYLHGRFARLIGRPIKDLEDYTIAEKMVIDHRNMMSYIYNSIDYFDRKITSRFIYRNPYFVDNFKYRLVEAIEFNTSHMSEWVMYGYDSRDNRIELEENVDYFNVFDSQTVFHTKEELSKMCLVNNDRFIFCKTYLFSDRMRELNIIKIEFYFDRVVVNSCVEYVTRNGPWHLEQSGDIGHLLRS